MASAPAVSNTNRTNDSRQSDVAGSTNPPDLKDLNIYVLKIGKKWFDLGVQLLDKDGPDKLDAIKENNPRDVEKCCTEMFQFWINNKTDASWKKLIAALKTIGLKVLADAIEMKHCK